MQIMLNCKFEYARILNLSDLREANSSVFYKKIAQLEKCNISHSIFDNNRNSDYKKLFVKDIPVIFAWGVSKNLCKLATMAINRIREAKPIGLKEDKLEYAYYHPLPRNNIKQIEWVKKITKMIKKAHNNS